MMGRKKLRRGKPRRMREEAPCSGGEAVLRLGAGILVGVGLSLALLALAAGAMKLAEIRFSAAGAVSLGIKILAALVAAGIAVGGCGRRAWLRGLTAGTVTLLAAGLLLRGLGAPEASGLVWASDAALGMLAGLLGGVGSRSLVKAIPHK